MITADGGLKLLCNLNGWSLNVQSIQSAATALVARCNQSATIQYDIGQWIIFARKSHEQININKKELQLQQCNVSFMKSNKYIVYESTWSAPLGPKFTGDLQCLSIIIIVLRWIVPEASSHRAKKKIKRINTYARNAIHDHHTARRQLRGGCMTCRSYRQTSWQRAAV